MDMTEDLGRRLKAHRVRLNLSQREAAEQLGVSVRALQTWEAGQTVPWPSHRRALERFLRSETVELEESA
jgi:transcriptional regulator with XRE-family HTH domain